MATIRSITQSSHSHRRTHSQIDLPSHTLNRQLPIRSATRHGVNEGAPWQYVAHAYDWGAVEHEYMKLGNGDRKTEQWILEQQMFLAAHGTDQYFNREPHVQQKVWEEMVYAYEVEALRWMRHEEGEGQRAREQERRARLVEVEIGKIERRIRHKREVERRKIAEERREMYEEFKEQERRSRIKTEEAVLEAWRDYEERWNRIVSTSELVTFSLIPWPVISKPTSVDDIKPAAIASFLLSHIHSKNLTRKERIRGAQLRWHPDRFQRIITRVKGEDKASVVDGVGIVARCLNDMMARETGATRQMRPIV